MFGERSIYVWASIAYLLSRLALYLLGVRFGVSYEWQFFHDPELLQHRLGETLLYTHAFTPAMDVFAGAALKLAGSGAPALYHAAFLACGLAFVWSLIYLGRRLALPRWGVLALAAAFCLSPAFIYFEALFLYTFPSAAVLAVSAVLFCRANARQTWTAWLAFFAVCAAIAYLRTTFHLVWFAAMLALAVAFNLSRWRIVLTAAIGPIALVVGWYAKNLVLFGFFGASSWFGFNLAIVTTKQLPQAERDQWVAEGRLHPVSAVSLYAPIERYADVVDIEVDTGVPVLDRKRRANGRPNYNHRAYIEVSRLRMRDNQYYLDQRTGDYVRTVLRGIVDYLRPTTRWHPRDKKASPHLANRAVLGPWENVYNAALHSVPIAPVGLYLLAPFALFYALWAAGRSLWRARGRGHGEHKLIVFLVLNSLYVPAVSCLVTIGELERYRFLVEGFMWLVCAWSLRQLVAAIRARRAAGGRWLPRWPGSRGVTRGDPAE